jgi:hypothetical protein
MNPLLDSPQALPWPLSRGRGIATKKLNWDTIGYVRIIDAAGLSMIVSAVPDLVDQY